MNVSTNRLIIGVNKKLQAALSDISPHAISVVVVIVLGGLVGSYFLTSSHAATPTVARETESGTVSSAASQINDTTASGGAAVKFSSGASSGGGGGGTLTNNCLSNPHACGFPDATNTGVPVGTTLTTVNGDVHTTSNGQVINAMDIHGTLWIDNSNVTVKNTKVTGGGGSSWAINVGSKTNVTGVIIQDCAIDAAKSDQGGVTGAGFSIYRCDISNGENAARPGGNALIQDCYMHTFRSSSSGPHYDGVEVYSGTGSKIVHNTIVLDQDETSTVNVQADFGNISGTIIDHNLLDGGGWMLNIRTNSGPVTGTQVTNNRLGDSAGLGYGAVNDGTTSAITGNVRDLTGVNIDSQI